MRTPYVPDRPFFASPSSTRLSRASLLPDLLHPRLAQPRLAQPRLAHPRLAHRGPLLAGLLLAALAATCGAQAGGAAANAVRPPLIHWQRTLKDAQALAKAKKLPLLVAVNQDGEPACESLANGRYRDPKFARLANRYVAVIASVDRHNPRDHDDQGRRILCPRFGSVTCGEHIAIEPKVFAAYFKNNRTAPRHIGIGPDGKELFDRFLDRSLAAIDDALRKGAAGSRRLPDLATTNQMLSGLVKSPADIDRRKLEERFAKGAKDDRIKVLKAATGSGIEHPALVRLGLMSEDAAVRAAATDLLAATATADSLDLTLQFLGRAPTDAEYAALLKALERPAKSDDNSRRALTIRVALAAKSERIDPEQWIAAYSNPRNDWPSETVDNEELAELDKRIDANTKLAHKDDPGGKLWMSVARDNLRYALNRMQGRKDPTFLLQDASASAERAVKAGYSEPEAAVLRARVLWLLNKTAEAGKQAEIAMSADPNPLLAQAGSPTALALLEIYARTQREPLQRPVESEDEYPAGAVTEVHRAYQALLGHPLATAAHAKAHTDFLLYLGARREAGIATRRAVRRFPADSTLHQLLRQQAMWEGGVHAVETVYESIQRERRDPAIDWFAGYAILSAAEGHVRASDLPRARVAYEKSIDDFGRSGRANPGYRDSAQHYIAICRGGLAKLALDARDLDAATRHVVAGAEARPASFGSPDALGNTLQRTARRLRRKLDDAKKADLEKRLAALGLKLD